MPIAPPSTIADEPEGGWPWQLRHFWVISVKGEGSKKSYKVKCKLCGWAPEQETTLYRCALHYRVTAFLKKTGAMSLCSHCADSVFVQGMA